MASLLKRRATARILTTVLLILVGFCFASTAQAATGATGPTGFSIKATKGDETTVEVSWTPPLDVLAQITAYSLRLDSNEVAQFKVINGLLPSDYVIAAAPFNPGGLVTVVALSGSAQVGPPSNAVKLNKSTSPVAPPTVAQAPSTSSFRDNGFGDSINNPPYADKNQLTPLEVYGSGIGIRSLPSTNNDKTQWIPATLNGWSGVNWLMAVIVGLAGGAIFGWSLIRGIYGGIVGAILALLNSLHLSPLIGDITLIAVALTMGWGAITMLKDEDRIRKGIGGAFLVLLASVTFFGNAAALVPQAILAPVTITQGTMAVTSKWEVPGDKPEDYNLSIKPTYNGNELEQAIRRYLNQKWLQTTYPAFCQLSFGSVAWSTTHKVPVDPNDKLPGFTKDLTFCEYLLKAQTENNTTALDKLRSDDSLGGAVGAATGGLAGHRKGYIELVSPAIWQNYQASSIDASLTRLTFSFVVLGSNFVDSIFMMGIGVFVTLTALLLGIDFIGLAFLLILGMIPPILEYLDRHVKEMCAKVWKPGLVMAFFMIMEKIVSVIFTASGVRGWLVETLLRGVTVAVVFVWGLIKIYRTARSHRAVREQTPPPQFYDRPNSPNSPGQTAPPQPASAAPRPPQEWTVVPNARPAASLPRAIAGSPALQGRIVAHQGNTAIASAPNRAGGNSPKSLPSAPSRPGLGGSLPRALPSAPRR